jgi:hypothetical protein
MGEVAAIAFLKMVEGVLLPTYHVQAVEVGAGNQVEHEV